MKHGYLAHTVLGTIAHGAMGAAVMATLAKQEPIGSKDAPPALTPQQQAAIDESVAAFRETRQQRRYRERKARG